MKCPQCLKTQKYKEGMVCKSCGYRFALSPKEPLAISDKAFQSVINKLSGPDGNYFTYDQLYNQIYRLARKKARQARIGCIVLLGVFCAAVLVFVSIPLLSVIDPGRVVFIGILAGLSLTGIIYYARSPIAVNHATVANKIEAYQAFHPIEKLATGDYFRHRSSQEISAEFFAYAPERILIMERDDIAEMLILNRFYLENKTLVVSANKYPDEAFQACQEFLSYHPELPVLLLHDASSKGVRMKKTLLADKTWALSGKNVQDLGLLPENLKQLKEPLWIPVDKSQSATPRPGTPEESIRAGLRLPVDLLAPKLFMSTIALSTLIGAPLLSEELLLQQQKYTVTDSASSGGGFG